MVEKSAGLLRGSSGLGTGVPLRRRAPLEPRQPVADLVPGDPVFQPHVARGRELVRMVQGCGGHVDKVWGSVVSVSDVPHLPQKVLLTSADERCSTGSPESQEKPAEGKVSQATDWAPVDRRQDTQWQIRLDSAFPVTLYRTSPQRHPPSLIFPLSRTVLYATVQYMSFREHHRSRKLI